MEKSKHQITMTTKMIAKSKKIVESKRAESQDRSQNTIRKLISSIV